MRLESSIQTEMITWLRKRKNSFTYKHCPDPTGYPDIEHFEKGLCFLFEVKRTKDHHPSAIQKLRIRQLKKTGVIVNVVWKLSQVKSILKSVHSLRS